MYYGADIVNELMMRYIIMENISEGIIGIDREKKINIINKRAKEIFGITYNHIIGHAEGEISSGDVVIIGDNALGLDDGGMGQEELKLLGVRESIPRESTFVYVGRFEGKGDYKYLSGVSGEILSISKNINGTEISSEVDLIQRKITIRVGENEFPYNFIKSIGHVVILDKDTLEVKFYQSKGYSVRKEDLKNILNGKRYLEKVTNQPMEVEVINRNITEVLGSSKSIEMLHKSTKNYDNIYDEINGRPVRCSIFPININGRNEGAVLKVEDLSEVKKIIDEKDEILRKLFEIEDRIYDPFNVINGESRGMKELLSYAKKAALSSLTILIMGESGTGKSLMAKAIHEYSKRREKKFVEINCGAISENLLESELFGYVSGAFTGAKREGKKGLIEYADGGTVFLDEISEMPVNLQVKLLHVIQDKKVIPVGGTAPIYVDVRFICASNKDLVEMVSKGTFREDLYYRVNVMPLKMPALRERKEDLHSICQSILSKICRREGMQYKILSHEAFKVLYEYDFPGNIRELENTLERALSISEGQYIMEEDILLPHSSAESPKNLSEVLAAAEKNAIINCLKQCNGDKQKAMEILDIKKTAFYEKVKKYNIDIK